MTDLVKVWIIHADVPPETVARCRDVLDESEQARAADVKDPRDGQRFAIAHGALRLLAGRELNTRPQALTFTFGRYGKPELADARLHTSLSHSGDLIAVAICASRQVGVDIQHAEAGIDTVALSARFFPPGEARYVAEGGDAGERADRFAHLWTRKEAVVKAVGGRLWPNLRIEVRDRDVVACAEPPGSHRVADLRAGARFRAAVALAGATPFTAEAGRYPDLATASIAARS